MRRMSFWRRRVSLGSQSRIPLGGPNLVLSIYFSKLLLNLLILAVFDLDNRHHLLRFATAPKGGFAAHTVKILNFQNLIVDILPAGRAVENLQKNVGRIIGLGREEIRHLVETPHVILDEFLGSSLLAVFEKGRHKASP